MGVRVCVRERADAFHFLIDMENASLTLKILLNILNLVFELVLGNAR